MWSCFCSHFTSNGASARISPARSPAFPPSRTTAPMRRSSLRAASTKRPYPANIRMIRRRLPSPTVACRLDLPRKQRAGPEGPAPCLTGQTLSEEKQGRDQKGADESQRKTDSFQPRVEEGVASRTAGLPVGVRHCASPTLHAATPTTSPWTVPPWHGGARGTRIFYDSDPDAILGLRQRSGSDTGPRILLRSRSGICDPWAGGGGGEATVSPYKPDEEMEPGT
jgi:hypothetical protein